MVVKKGTKIKNVLDGIFYGVREYSDGGLTVRIRHKFPKPFKINGKRIKYFYSFYMHM